ncbi:high affinity branched-chain amino acid ABC transporter, ATP-binding protein [Nautilia profundicola AmH]|uniref:High affinity branched-chain amino acid ABC transporter, ATP-binding protein n=1 Tax=Nautilia profundicola (strain ATCC BAA-1463 / DSM 18972 / AmH) TaxID=598659 RepID=B9L7M6_NAUPA|nr:ABC transporter ATP-binding protein [Nautilia profundicola]ACM92111.1 high affinity branched-chain amino acid ABC transporter, ATP-binding protein [Nautilia profundicola AmH]
MLKVNNLKVKYGVIEAVRGIDFEVKAGEIVTIIGANGAGKTSTLSAIFNLVKKEGTVRFVEGDISKLSTDKIVKHGMALVPEGRRIFINLTVEENLKIGAYTNEENYENLKEEMFRLFPRLKQKRNNYGGSLSGGEQQMLAIARALMSEPKMLVLDEPSLGLAPIIVKDLFGILVDLNKNDDVTILLVEQNAAAALKIADRAYVMENGSLVMEDDAKALLASDEIKKKYLGG